MNPLVAAFLAKVDDLTERHLESQDIKSVESDLIVLLRIIKENPDLARNFEQIFIAMLDDISENSILPIIFCMHDLRLAAVLDYAKRLESEAPITEWSRKRRLQRVIAAFDDDWIERQMFSYFGTNLAEKGDN